MLDPLGGLTDAQRRAACHAGGPLLVLGGAGTGKTRVLVARFAWLVEQGERPEAVVLVARRPDELRVAVEDALAVPFEELVIARPRDLAARLLRDEAAEAGIDPLPVPVTSADRLAMLLERIDELTLRVHDFRGDAASLVGGFVRRIDRLKQESIGAEDYAAWAAGLPVDGDVARARAAREREFAGIYQAHEAMLATAGVLDEGDLVLAAVRLLRERAHVRARVAARWRHVLVDDLQELAYAPRLLLRLLSCEHSQLVAAGDDDQALGRLRGAAAKNLRDLETEYPELTTVVLERSLRSGDPLVSAARTFVEPIADRIDKPLSGAPDTTSTVAFWRCENERAQAQTVAAEVERLVGREGVAPERIGVLVRSVVDEGHAVAVALEERAVPHRVAGASAFFQRPEVRDVIAWLRMLADPGDAGAVVRALARPPVELRSVDLARCTQIARRRKLDMVAALVAATESPQIPPEARERILAFLKLHRQAMASFDSMRPDLYLHRLIDRLGLRRAQLFTAQADVVERLVNLARLGDLAAGYARREPQGTPRDFARYLAAVAEARMREAEPAPAGPAVGVQVISIAGAAGLEFECVFVLGCSAANLAIAPAATHEDEIDDALLHEALPPHGESALAERRRRLLYTAVTRARRHVVLAYPAESAEGAAQPPSPLVEDARAALGALWEDRAEELFGPAEALHATYSALRDEVLGTVARTSKRLSELRFDTDLDVSHAVVRFLELIKLSALIHRAPEQGPAEAIEAINQRLLQAVSPEQREVFLTSTLDDYLLGVEQDAGTRAQALAARDEPSLERFLPRRGEGLLLSASDIDTYRTCPLKYKFRRVFRIPSEPTLNQRFGIAVHQVLERFHTSGASTLAELLGLLDAAWRRGGFGESEQERQLHGKATDALTRYHGRFQDEDSEPVWFERSFTFKLGPHMLRGRVDRVDRLATGGYELIDYKTGRPRSVAQLREDVQLSLYAIGAREAWSLDAARGSYYYVLDDTKVAVPDAADEDWITATVMEVAEGIEAQGFEPTPSYTACAACDYRITCPAAER